MLLRKQECASSYLSFMEIKPRIREVQLGDEVILLVLSIQLQLY